MRDFETITVYVPAATAQETAANVAPTRHVAVSCTYPLSHESTQIKWADARSPLAPPSDEALGLANQRSRPAR